MTIKPEILLDMLTRIQVILPNILNKSLGKDNEKIICLLANTKSK